MRFHAVAPGGRSSRRWRLLVHCFLDDSGKDGQSTNPFVVMAGYFGEEAAWNDLQMRWDKLLLKHAINGVHMKELDTSNNGSVGHALARLPVSAV